MQLGEVKSKDTVKVPVADWKTLISLPLGLGFTSTSPLSNTRSCKERQMELI